MQEAETGFNSLYSWMRRCRLEPIKRAAETLKRHKDNILAYFKNRITNAICEGINSMIQAAKRKARGFHTFEGYSTMIYLIAGKLQLAVPSPF
jgi:transposase